MEESKEEIKSNKMKKSELKEMIRNAFLNEGAVEIMDAYNDVLDLVKKHSRRLSDDDSYAFGLKLKAWFNKNILAEAEKDEDVEDVEVEDDVDVDTDMDAGEGGTIGDVQDNLEAALEAARKLGDEKLVDQIGNSITFFTRTHVVGKDAVAEADIDINSPAEEAEIGMELNESINRMQKLAGLIK